MGFGARGARICPATPRFLPLATNILGWNGGTTTFTLTNPAAAPCRFYRVGVE